MRILPAAAVACEECLCPSACRRVGEFSRPTGRVGAARFESLCVALMDRTQDETAVLRGLLPPPDPIAKLAYGDADRVFRLESTDE